MLVSAHIFKFTRYNLKLQMQRGVIQVPGDVPTQYLVSDVICNTSQPNCSGTAYFSNPTDQTASFAVWLENGSLGQSNFTLNPGASHSIHCQSGDTYSSAWGDSGVPDNALRNWIDVGKP